MIKSIEDIDNYKRVDYNHFEKPWNFSNSKNGLKEFIQKNIHDIFIFKIEPNISIDKKEVEKLQLHPILKTAIEWSNHETINMYFLHAKDNISKYVILGTQKGSTGRTNNALLQEVLQEKSFNSPHTKEIKMSLSELKKYLQEAKTTPTL